MMMGTIWHLDRMLLEHGRNSIYPTDRPAQRLVGLPCHPGTKSKPQPHNQGRSPLGRRTIGHQDRVFGHQPHPRGQFAASRGWGGQQHERSTRSPWTHWGPVAWTSRGANQPQACHHVGPSYAYLMEDICMTNTCPRASQWEFPVTTPAWRCPDGVGPSKRQPVQNRTDATPYQDGSD